MIDEHHPLPPSDDGADPSSRSASHPHDDPWMDDYDLDDPTPSDASTGPPRGREPVLDLTPPIDPSDERARLLARLIAAGVPLAEAVHSLRLDAVAVSRLVSHPDWPALVREEVKNVDILYDEDAVRRMLDPLIPAAIQLKNEILRDENAALKLRNEVASEVLKIAGLHRTKRQEVHVFVHPARQTVHATVAELASASDDEDD